ncbi:hypothetical protein [Aliiroseovarius sp.]|uniref:hypothetical protein n=1 Tax=Aliiroseovarius sp. TaxID=1872442 RepID=UPI0026199EDE|nr:hypothetical protein [Aliiroseovarius sp.]
MLPSLGGTQGARAAQSMMVAGGTLRVKGPEGYCVDTGASRTGEADGFVLLGSCRAISHHPRDPHPERPMVLTVAVSARAGQAPADPEAPPARDLAGLETYLRSDTGRQALSRTGDADSVQIARALQQDGVLYLHITDDSPNPMGAVTGAYWRAFFDLRGAAVSVTVTALASQPVDEGTALAQIQRAVAALRAANPERGTTAGRALAGLADRFLGRNNSGAGPADTPAPIPGASAAAR